MPQPETQPEAQGPLEVSGPVARPATSDGAVARSTPAVHPAEAVESVMHGFTEPSLVTRVAFFTFVSSLAVVASVLAAILVSERSALRRADADLYGALGDRCARAIVRHVDRAGGDLTDEAFEAIREEIALLAEAKGVRQVALFLNDGQDVLSAQSNDHRQEVEGASGSDARSVPLPLPVVTGPGRTLRDDHLVVARSFPLRPTADAEALLAVEATYPGVDRRMRDLVALTGRALGMSALFLVFLIPLAARWLLRAHLRVARGLEAGWLPSAAESTGGGAELATMMRRIEHDAEALHQYEREHAEFAVATRGHVDRLRREVEAGAAAVEEARVVARSATQAKAAFVANTSHEIRTPLHAVLGTTGLLLATDLDAEQRSLAERATRASRMLLALVDDVLDLARFDAHEITVELTRFDAGALIEEVAELGAALAATKGLELSAFVDPNIPTWLVGDPQRIRQALMRLVDNAIKFTDTGEVSLELAWESSEGGVPLAVFTVADTGLGIDDVERARLFQAFEQLDASDTRRHGGVGLGLALVARIARAMGGEVRLESRRGRGATFRLALPLTVDPSHAKELTEGRSEAHAPLEGCRILVLDDATRATEHLIRTLGALGATANAELSTYAGFEELLRADYDVVFVDSLLAGRDAFLGALESNERYESMPVVLMTPAQASQLPGGARDEAVSYVVAKPLRRDDLVSVIESVLNQQAGSEPNTGESAPRGTGAATILESDVRERVKILLVEDNHTNQQLVQYVLGKRGYSVDIAVNGKRAVDAFTVGDYDVVLMDCQMPEMDGYEATRRIRALEHTRGTRTPILAMTASVLESDRERCIASGMDDLLPKPFQPNEMVEWLERWLLRSLYGDHDAAPLKKRTTRAEAMEDARAHSAAARAAAAGGVSRGANAIDGADEGSSVSAVDDVAGGDAKAGQAAELPSLEGVLDKDVLGALMDDEEGRILAFELVDSFMGITPGKLRAMEEAVEAGDLAFCASVAHGLVSTSGTVGAVRLARLLRDVERLASLGKTEDSARLVADCRTEVETARLALSNLQPTGALRSIREVGE